MRIPPSGVVEFMAQEGSSDLALLRVPAGTARAVERFWQERGIHPGAGVAVLGWPLRGLLASEANVSTGVVSALAGLGARSVRFTIQHPRRFAAGSATAVTGSTR